ncbi:MAG TPA: hypothetical protein DEO60_02885 [Bacteroidales bacterium]|nr:hypothetical protein [Bacteroidales bacterium]HBZ20049.1 hypothetical protein [Bacteroidales bacterium]
MKPEKTNITGRRIYRRLIYFHAFLFIFSASYSQTPVTRDSPRKLQDTLKTLGIENIRLSLSGTDFSNSTGLVPSAGSEDKKTLIFLDSLKIRASRKLITKKLYDFLIISHEPESRKEINGSSEKSYTGYSGLKIRNIEIKRLDVFGSNINAPDFYGPDKTEKLLNKTHFYTNEIIIRKNLLFNAGDTISPLNLSDNERFLRELPYIDDARIVVVPVSDEEADIIVVTRDIYSLGARVSFGGFEKGSIALFDRNIFGMGHEFGIEVPYDSKFSDSPGFGVSYKVNNIFRTFVNLDTYFNEGLGKKTFGFDLGRKLMSASTKYAGNISVKEMFTSDDLDSLPEPAPVKYNLQDYWLLRSFLLDAKSVSRLILGTRYTNNNVFAHPYILPESFHYLQQYKMFLASVSFSAQKYYKTNLVYGYGLTEDIPYGKLINMTIGREFNEFKVRNYLATSVSFGGSVKSLGYFYTSAGFGTFINKGQTEQGILSLRTNFISNLAFMGRYRIRNFVNIDYTRGFDRYSDEYLDFNRENGFSGFRNDSIGDSQRLSFSIESVLFSPVDFYGFRFALFGFADAGFLFGTNEFVGNGDLLSAIGLGIRIRNNNLIFNTFQIRLGFFPNLPEYSRTNPLIVSGQQLLKPVNFEPGKPSVIPFR